MDAALMSSQLNAVSPRLIMTIGPLPDGMKPNSLRQNALDPRFHGVPAGPAHTPGEADGAGVA
jgi:hypothetical protein